MQYRVGTTGSFINLTGIEYQNNTTNQIGSGVTTPQNLQPRSITLPAAANNASVVQIRWASRQVSGAGARPSFAVDNISVNGTPITAASITTSVSSLSGFSYVAASGPSAAQSFSVSGTNLDNSNVVITAPTSYEVSTT